MSPRRRGAQAEGEQRQPPHGAARHPGTAGLGTARHGQPDGRHGAAAGRYIGRAGREEAAAAAPAPIGFGAAGGRAGAATAPPSPAGVGGPAPLKQSGRAIL